MQLLNGDVFVKHTTFRLRTNHNQIFRFSESKFLMIGGSIQGWMGNGQGTVDRLQCWSALPSEETCVILISECVIKFNILLYITFQGNYSEFIKSF